MESNPIDDYIKKYGERAYELVGPHRYDFELLAKSVKLGKPLVIVENKEIPAVYDGDYWALRSKEQFAKTYGFYPKGQDSTELS
jgi:hypothetical protein